MKKDKEFIKSLINKYLLLIFALALSMACRKNEKIFSGNKLNLRFSADTLYLDTVFNSVSSSTRALRVFNPNKEKIVLNSVSLARGESSFYRMNVNGINGRRVENVEILPEDSIYIFVEITPESKDSPELLYVDSIVFSADVGTQYVNVVSLVKDAYFHFPNRFIANFGLAYSTVGGILTFPNDKPHVVYGYLVVDENEELTLLPGTQMHFHSGSGLWVFNGGRLLVDPNDMGGYENQVVFQGDRLEPFYKDIPGQWGGALGGIFIMGNSTGNIINNAVIQNGTIGLLLDSTTLPNPNVRITNTIIRNHSRAGIFGGYAHVEGGNLLVYNCGLYALYALGGRYDFKHCTFANYWNQSVRSTPAVGLFNFFEDANGIFQVRDISRAYFGSCIIYGSNIQELGINELPGSSLSFEARNCLIRVNPDPDRRGYDITNAQRFNSCLFNLDPLFVNPTKREFFPIISYELKHRSPAIDQANFDDFLNLIEDIKGSLRPFQPPSGDTLGILPIPDIGVYEFSY